jgi:hypothetical protein
METRGMQPTISRSTPFEPPPKPSKALPHTVGDAKNPLEARLS